MKIYLALLLWCVVCIFDGVVMMGGLWCRLFIYFIYFIIFFLRFMFFSSLPKPVTGLQCFCR